MCLLRVGCLALLLTLSSPSNALMDGYYSQAVDIDYALPSENESMRVKLEKAIRKFLDLVALDEDGSSVGLYLDYFGSNEHITSGH